ncbi:cytochrome P450 [Phyllobacterium myrsinacearum]|uniref:Cytochrome P450 n=1 Tax=Phyllobacterium myrsinacearum TaxID=28101 RepID=A0A839ETH5_9HYPH|nr:cytochrome P450 [Phyllobacterium myrsinacearum]MBA8881488.1 cytochrome P450 [Phyllobacterium myrsinacearum]
MPSEVNEKLQTQLSEPSHVRAAPSHPDPYPYYARLAVQKPLFREEQSGAWVAASAAMVKSVLMNDDCRTRPFYEPVPGSIEGTAMAEIFRYLVRMNDGENHRRDRGAVAASLQGICTGQVVSLAKNMATELTDLIEPKRNAEQLTRFMFSLPAFVIGALLGIPREKIEAVAHWVGDYSAAATAAVTGVPLLDAKLIQTGSHAASQLLVVFRMMLEALDKNSGTLLALQHRKAQQMGNYDANAVIANGIGYMAQGCVACSTVIGNTLLALSRNTAIQAKVDRNPTLLANVVQEVLRCDPTTHSTLRFVSRDTAIAGQKMQQGDTIIVLLAAASRDPTLNPEPNVFDIFRPNRKYLEFSVGSHACPGVEVATLVAEAAIKHLLDIGLDVEGLADHVSYRASAHVRIPIFNC